MSILKNYLTRELDELVLGTKSAKHPFHQFVFTNITDNRPESRTVVLRNIIKEKQIIEFNTDKRSPKYSELKINNNISALFYDSTRKVQLRINGNANILSDNSKKIQIWENLTRESKVCYMGDFSPSSKLGSYSPNIPKKKITELTDDEYSSGYLNFARIQIVFSTLDFLLLHSNGHKRIKYTWTNGGLEETWLAT